MNVVTYDKNGAIHFKQMVASDMATAGEELALLSLDGAPQAIRAAWAHLVTHRTQRSITSTEVGWREGPSSARMCVNPKGPGYTSVRDRGQLTILHRGFAPGKDGRFFFGGDEEEMSPYFEGALKRFTRVPYIPEWLPAIWKAAIEQGLLVPLKLTKCGLPIWQVSLDENKWQQLIVDLVKKGEVTWPD